MARTFCVFNTTKDDSVVEILRSAGGGAYIATGDTFTVDSDSTATVRVYGDATIAINGVVVLSKHRYEDVTDNEIDHVFLA